MDNEILKGVDLNARVGELSPLKDGQDKALFLGALQQLASTVALEKPVPYEPPSDLQFSPEQKPKSANEFGVETFRLGDLNDVERALAAAYLGVTVGQLENPEGVGDIAGIYMQLKEALIKQGEGRWGLFKRAVGRRSGTDHIRMGAIEALVEGMVQGGSDESPNLPSVDLQQQLGQTHQVDATNPDFTEATIRSLKIGEERYGVPLAVLRQDPVMVVRNALNKNPTLNAQVSGLVSKLTAK